MYKEVCHNRTWNLIGKSTDSEDFMSSPLLQVKDYDNSIIHYPLYLWGQTLVFRIAKLLEDKNIGLPTYLNRMWFNATYHGKKTQHWLHQDDRAGDSKNKSILLFMTPIWQPDWRGSFFIDGEEIKFKPGSAVIFDSKEFHKGESPTSEKYNWQRITCNMMVSPED